MVNMPNLVCTLLELSLDAEHRTTSPWLADCLCEDNCKMKQCGNSGVVELLCEMLNNDLHLCLATSCIHLWHVSEI